MDPSTLSHLECIGPANALDKTGASWRFWRDNAKELGLTIVQINGKPSKDGKGFKGGKGFILPGEIAAALRRLRAAAEAEPPAEPTEAELVHHYARKLGRVCTGGSK